MASETPPATRQHLSAIVGFHLVTADLPRLRAFYRDVLGFAPDGSEQAIGTDEMALLGLRGSGRRQSLILGGQTVTIDRFDTPGRPYPANANAAALGFQHLALVVTDIGPAYRRVSALHAISKAGVQQLPASAGGVSAYKFRDPDGHPLELLQFPANSCPAIWRGKSAIAGQIGLGIDHSAISVADADASAAYYGSLGLAPDDRTLNQGPRQQDLDGLDGVRVSVVPMRPAAATPHLELLGYRSPRGIAGPASQAHDIAATRIVWQGARAALLRDPDGHLQQIVATGRKTSA